MSQTDPRQPWYSLSRHLGWDEAPPFRCFIKRRRWFNRQRRIYWLESALELREYETFPPFWRDDW